MLPDIVLCLPPSDDKEASPAIDQAIHFASLLDGQLTGVAVATNYKVHPNWLSEVAGISRLAGEENQRSRAGSAAALAAFEKAARERGVFGGGLLTSADFGAEGDAIAAHTRPYDFCLLPATAALRKTVVEDVLFGAGRGVLLYQPGSANLPRKLDVVLLAWDGSRCAARAMSDALPILKKAGRVKVLSVLNEKADVFSGAGAAAIRHLATHGVRAEPMEIEASGEPIGEILDAAVQDSTADLLVMGAFGSSRLREFVLGGATRHVLDQLRLATFLSH